MRGSVVDSHGGAPTPKKKKKKSSGGMGFLDLNPGKQARSLAEVIENQAATQKAIAQKKAQESSGGMGGGAIDPYSAMQQQLFDAINSVPYQATPLDEIKRQAGMQVDAQFNPMMEALSRQMMQHQDRAKTSKKEARGMYGALANDFLNQLPALTAQFAAEDQATNSRYDTAQAELQKQYGEQAQQQDAVLRRLGIQAAGQESSQQARDDQAYFQSQLELDQKRAMDAQDMQQSAAMNYQRDLGNNAKMTGENTAQDIGRMLQEYMTEAEGQMTGLQSQKSAALANLISQMQGQDQQHADQIHQQNIDNLMKAFQFQLDATNAGNQNNLAMMKLQGDSNKSLFGGTTGLAGASNYLAEQYPDQPVLAGHLMDQINDVLRNKNVVNGKFVLQKGDQMHGPKYADVTPEYMVNLLKQEFKKEGGYSPRDINNTVNALLAYLGKLR